MKTLETQFVSGEGGFSTTPLTYTQIHRNGKFAVYQRSLDGKIKDYETICIRTLKAGTQIFKQILSEDEERYPGTSQWGHYAWSFGNQTAAINKLNELVNKESSPVKSTEIKALTTTKKSKGRPKSNRPTLIFPIHQDTFTIKQLLAINNQWTQPLVYIEIQKQIKEGNITIHSRTKSSSGRGRATVNYQKIGWRFTISDLLYFHNENKVTPRTISFNPHHHRLLWTSVVWTQIQMAYDSWTQKSIVGNR